MFREICVLATVKKIGSMCKIFPRGIFMGLHREKDQRKKQERWCWPRSQEKVTLFTDQLSNDTAARTVPTNDVAPALNVHKWRAAFQAQSRPISIHWREHQLDKAWSMLFLKGHLFTPGSFIVRAWNLFPCPLWSIFPILRSKVNTDSMAVWVRARNLYSYVLSPILLCH